MLIKKILNSFLICLFFLSIISCNSNSTSTQSATTTEEKKQIEKADSIAVEMDKTSKKVEENTKKMKREVDDLLEGI